MKAPGKCVVREVLIRRQANMDRWWVGVRTLRPGADFIEGRAQGS